MLTATPGPSVLLCVSKSVSHGFSSAIVAATGSLIAIIMIMTLSFTGLGIVLSTSDLIFSFIKWAGAAYLIFLGVKAFTSKIESFEKTDELGEPKDLVGHWVSGFIVGASNPKALIFFTALFPQFINSAQPLVKQYFILMITFALLEMFWLGFYALLANRSSKWLMKPGRAKRFNQLTGGVFIGAGLFLSSTTRAHG